MIQRIAFPLVLLLSACGPAIPKMPPAPASALPVQSIRGDSDRRFAILLAGVGEPDIFAHYVKAGPSRWARNFTLRMNFTGVAWDDSRTATLVSPAHVVMAGHYQRPPGSQVTFHDRRGKAHVRTLTAVVPLSGVDVCVGKLDSPVPDSVSFYRLLPPSPSNPGLAGCLVVATNHSRRANIHEIHNCSGRGLSMVRPDPSRISRHLTTRFIKGDSGNPTFLLVGGELVLVETHTYGGNGSGPFYSAPETFAAINAAMKQLGGGHQLSVVPVRKGG